MANELLCPSCHRSVTAQMLTYSQTLDAFVCPACQSAAAAQALGKGLIQSPPTDADSAIDDAVDFDPSEFIDKPKGTTPVPSTRQGAPIPPLSQTRDAVARTQATPASVAAATSTTPDASRTASEASHISPETLRTAPEASRAMPETSRTSPEASRAAPETSRAAQVASNPAQATSRAMPQRPSASMATPPPITPSPTHPRTPSSKPDPASQRRIIFALALVAGAAIITLLAIALTHLAPNAEQQARAWDAAHHDEIIAMKSQAEALAIQGKLKEAHAKYREIEQLVGNHQIKDPTLEDMIEVCRQDQDHIYKILLARMDPHAGQNPGMIGIGANTEASAAANPAATPQTPPPANLPRQSYPSSFNALGAQPAMVDADEQAPHIAAPAPSAPPSPPPTTTAPASTTPVSSTPASPVPVSPPAPPANAVSQSPPHAFTPSPAQSPSATRSADADEATPPRIATFAEIPRGPVSDEQVGQAIQRAVDYLMTKFQDGQIKIDEPMSETQLQGVDALCVYALAASGKAVSDPRLGAKSAEMMKMLDQLKTYPLDATAQFQVPVTYARSLRACALAAFNRPQDRDVLDDDVDWCIHAATDGAYTYDDRYSTTPRQRKFRHPATRPANASGRASAWMSDGPVAFPKEVDDVRAPLVLTDGIFTPRPPVPPRPQIPGSIELPKIFSNHLRLRVNTQPHGRYSSRFPWDNSNSQYGLLGVWAGAEVGCEVPSNYWRNVQLHWTDCQLPSGEWNYAGDNEGGRFSMTCAGVASLLVTDDYLNAAALGGRTGIARAPYSTALQAGLSWLEDNDNAVNILGQPLFYVGYNLYGIERVGLASGFKQFGSHDWFVELAAKTLPTQFPNGAFGRSADGGDSIVDTAYVLLFLARGRAPIMMNKLLFDGYWSNRPRDIANLANYTARQLERPVNWQVVNLNREPTDWADAPILYIASHIPISLTDADLSKLSDFVDAGGIIFTHADADSAQFNHFAEVLAKKLFPAYELRDLPTDHPIYTLNYNIPLPRPRLQGVSNGSRLLMIHSPTDLSVAWQTRAFVSRQPIFQLGTNIYLYATGKERFRNRLDTPTIPPPQGDPVRTIPLARLKYAGNWDPEPGAWPRMARLFQWETGIKVDLKFTPIKDLSFTQTHLAHLTGTDAFTPTPDELAALKQFVSAGGTLLVDATGGSGTFADGENTWLPHLLGPVKLEPVTPGDPLLKQTTDYTTNVPTKTLRLFALEQLGGADVPRLKHARLGAGQIIFSPLDITSGLLGTNTWGILGYLPEYAQALANNLIATTK